VMVAVVIMVIVKCRC